MDQQSDAVKDEFFFPAQTLSELSVSLRFVRPKQPLTTHNTSSADRIKGTSVLRISQIFFIILPIILKAQVLSSRQRAKTYAESHFINIVL